MKRKNSTLAKTTIMSALAVGLSVACIPSAIAYSTEKTEAAELTAVQEATPAEYEKTEVAYATLSATGAAKGVYVVNQFDVSVAGSVEDFGAYSTVANLTDQGALKYADGATSFEVGEGAFYYQGNTAVDAVKLPWNVAISYTLDGAAVSPEELAGKSGDLAIHVTTSRAEGVDPSFYDCFMLQLTFTLNGDMTTDIVAEGATIASAGRDRTVAFTVLPGKNADCTLTAKVSDFEMAGVQIAALPYAMVMEMPDTSDMEGQMQELSNAVGLLADNGETIAAASNEFNNALDMMSANLTPENLAALQGLPDQIGALLPSPDELEDIADELFGKVTELEAQAAELEKKADLLAQNVAIAVAQEEQAAGGEEGSTEGSSGTEIQMPTTPDEMRAYAQKLRETAATLRVQAEALDAQAAQLDVQGPLLVGQLSGLVDLAGGVAQLGANYDAFNSGLQEYVGGISQLNQATIKIPATMRAEIEAMMADYDFPEFDPISFVDSRNDERMAAVQFVLTTDAIAVEEPEAVEEEEPAEETIVDRFFALFQ